MKETFDQLRVRHENEFDKCKEAHSNQIIELLMTQEWQIKKQGGITPAMQVKFNKELNELKEMHKAIEEKMYQRHRYEKELSDKEYQEKQLLKQIIRGDVKPKKEDIEEPGDKDIDDYDDYDKE